MSRRFIASRTGAAAVALYTCLVFGLVAQLAQSEPRQNQDSKPAAIWNSPSIPFKEPPPSSGPAPRRDISGTWDAYTGGIGSAGVKSHAPFTEWGEKIASSYKAGDGPRKVPVGLVNDPLDSCDPAGTPRNLLFELRPFEVVQTPDQVLMLYEYQKVWRAIWTDGRELPTEAESRWYGYSVGHWEDDYTFIVDTFGLDERTWLDNAGNPHSGDMRVQEIYHRVDRDVLELTIKIDDPKAYTEPWLALNKLILRRQPASFDIREMICVPSEAEQYKKVVAYPSTN